MTSGCLLYRRWIVLTLICFPLAFCTSADEKLYPQLHKVEIKQMKFQPDDLLIQSGDTVIFINRDFMVHDVTEESSKEWASSPLEPGMEFRITVKNNSSYYCSLHPVMKGKIVVERTPLP